MATRKDREREKARRDARRREWQAKEPACASDHIKPFNIVRSQPVVIAARVSTPQQAANGDLDDQLAYLQYAVDLQGGKVAGKYSRTGPGHETGWLEEAATHARNTGSVLLLESTDRLIRPPHFDKSNQSLTADPEEVKKLVDRLGVVVMTCLDPDATWKEIRAHQTRRGKTAKGSPTPYPGYKKELKERWQGRVEQLHGQQHPTRRIARIVSYEAGTPISHMTVQRWLAA